MTAVENTSSAYTVIDRVRDELAVLFERRMSVSSEVLVHRARGDLENNDPYHSARETLHAIDRRISDLDNQIRARAEVLPEDGVARLGSLVTVMFDHDRTDVEALALLNSDVDGMQSCSPTSPLGAALMGSRVHETHTYTLPSGSESSVTVLAVSAL